MSVLKNIWADLRDKKLWPVAVALVLALVAVPILLGGGSSAPPASSAAVPQDASTAATKAAVVAVDDRATADTEPIDRKGKVVDPFRQHHQVKTNTTPATSPTGPTTPTGSSGGTPSTDTAPAKTDTTSTTPAKTDPAPTTKAPSTDTYTVDLKFGEAGTGKNFKNVPRLTPLPDADNPFFVFMGVSDDGKSAVFLISNDSVPSGDGTCTPSADACETVTLKPGETEFFDLQNGTAGITEYELDVTKITKGKAKTSAEAAKAHTRESSAGREYLRTVIAADPKTMSDWQWDQDLGQLVSMAPAAKTATR
jgi:hypothetical protein